MGWVEQSLESVGGHTGLGWLWREEGGELLAWHRFLFERRKLKPSVQASRSESSSHMCSEPPPPAALPLPL